MMKHIVLCADDYGQAPAISQAIITLIQHQRLSATSCLVNMPDWQEHGLWLKLFQDQVDIGLHFNLTEGLALSTQWMTAYGVRLFTLKQLLCRAFLHQLDMDVIAAECEAQINRFNEIVGFFPHFIDGHHHVHQFPVIREAVIKAYKKHLSTNRSYIRFVDPTITFSDGMSLFKKAIIYAMGARSFRKLLQAHHIPYPASFTGMYAFSQSESYGSLCQRFLQEIGDGGLMMCHPGLVSADAEDGIAKARFDEYQYLISDLFLKDCQKWSIRIGRLLSK